MKKTEYVVEFFPEPDGRWNARVPDLPGCVSWGNSLPEARDNIKEAMAGWIAVCIESGMELPQPQSYVLGMASVEIPA
jgi:predicted RNase H-like HicB family nuclease